MYHDCIKRPIDCVLAFFLLLLCSPLLLITAIAIKITSPGPLFFIQNRLGYKERIFSLYKFRSMTDRERVGDREILKDDPEVTTLGGYLRRLKIDELPQLLNILKGDMSFVGPRPCLPRQLEAFDANGKCRTRVRPGLTGLAQVNGNIYLSWPERWAYDKKYVENISPLLDIKIILKTVAIVIFGEDKFIRKHNA